MNPALSLASLRSAGRNDSFRFRSLTTETFTYNGKRLYIVINIRY